MSHTVYYAVRFEILQDYGSPIAHINDQTIFSDIGHEFDCTWT